MFTGLHSEMRQTTQQFVRFSESRIQNPKSGMGYGRTGYEHMLICLNMEHGSEGSDIQCPMGILANGYG